MLVLFGVLSILGLIAWGLHLYYRAGQIDRRLDEQQKLQTKVER